MNRTYAFHQLLLKAEASAGCALLMEVKALTTFCANIEKISNPVTWLSGKEVLYLLLLDNSIL